MRVGHLLAASLAAASVFAGCASAPPPERTAGSGLVIEGDVLARTLAFHDLERLGTVEVEWHHKNELGRFEAVPLEAVLRSVGVEPGTTGPNVPPSEKRAAWKFAVVA